MKKKKKRKEKKKKKEEWNGLTGLEGGKPCKKFGGKRQKICSVALPSRREKKS